MDFFKGLDPVRYSDFRATINNQMELNSTIKVTTNLDYIPPPTIPAEKSQPGPDPKIADVLVTAEAVRTSAIKNTEGENSKAHVTCFKCGHQVNNAVDENLKVGPNEILLDNQADISIIRPHQNFFKFMLTGTSNSSVGENYTWHNGIRSLLC
mmetsp:Transcript_21398/g.30637  ORF Transcript_21398/g.30637 Transcript_21398/m.30637 type:complete len:153 (-) Transcript_21398:650-1108(-)